MSGIIKPPINAQLNLDHPLAKGLVGAWLMNEGSGNLIHDYSGQNNEGTLSGFNDPPIATSGWNAGPHGGALAFDGNNDYVDCGYKSIMNTNRITVTVWFNANDVGIQQRGILHRDNGVTYRSWNVVIRTSDIIVLKFKATVQLSQTTALPYDDDLWHFMAMVNNDDDLLIYMDSKLIAGLGNGKGGNIDSFLQPLQIGRWRNTAESFPGFISSVSIYNRALSAEEIAYLYAFPYCMFDEPAYPAWMRKHVSAQDYYRNLLAGSDY